MADKCIGKLTLDITDVQNKAKQVDKILKSIATDKTKIDLSKRFVLDDKEIAHKVEAINNALAKVGSNAGVKIQIAEEVKKQIDKVYKSLDDSAKKITDTAKNAIDAINKIGQVKVENAHSDKALKDSVTALKEYYQWLTKVEQAKQQGNAANVALYEDKAAEALAKVNAELREQAEAYATVQKAKAAMIAAQNKTAEKELARETKEVENATKAYIKWIEAKSKLKQLEFENKQETPEYAKVAQASGKAYDAFMKYSQGARDAAAATREAKQAMSDLANIEEAVANKAEGDYYLTQIRDKYFDLTDAIKRYNAERNSNNELGMATEQAKIDGLMNEVHIIEQIVRESDIEAGVKQQILSYVQQCVTAETQHVGAIEKSRNATSELESQVQGLIMRYMSLMAVIRAITTLLGNMVEYVSEYSDKMNEIQMITLKTDAEIEKLATTYRDLAAEMSVSSLDMADAAIYFTRQGLAAEEIEKRLRNVTMYAKAANVEFKDASEIITAVVNSMGLVEQEAEDGRNAAQRVADVFLAIGDSAATSGQEIGEAMQKAAASAGAFGVSMEWLAAYIATVSETTRQEARTIGTALNTIIARLHQIKQTGYNQEDETKINDVAKALANIDVALMDQYGNWRDMEDIFIDIAAKWEDLDDKTRSYIATTMAGVKQQNVFLALMNDMAKGAEKGSRAFELYGIAIDSAGTAADKYSVYLDSVTASQERLNVAQEKFYALLGEDIIKGWNNFLAGFISMVAKAADTLSGLNIIIPIVIAGVAGIATAVSGLNAKLGRTIVLADILKAHPIMMAIGAAALVLTGFVTLISAIGNEIETTAERFDRASDKLAKSQGHLENYQRLQDETSEMFEKLGSKVNATSEDLGEYEDLLDALAAISPNASAVVQQLRDDMIDQTEAAQLLNDELENLIDNESELSMISLRNKYDAWTPSISNESNSGVLQNWDTSHFESSDKFAQIVAQRWDASKLDTNLRHQWFSDDMIEIIESDMGEFRDAIQSHEMDLMDAWRITAQDLWENAFFGDDGHESIAERMAEEANDMIDEVIMSVSAHDRLNDIETSYAEKYLRELIFGEDGVLSMDEYTNAGQTIKEYVTEIIANGFEIKPEDIIQFIGENYLGNYFDILFGDQLEELKNSSEFGEISNNISDVVSELIRAGFTETEIAELLESLPLSEWEFALNRMVDMMRNKIKATFNVDQLGVEIQDMDDGYTHFDEMLWNDLDLETLKLIDDLANLGVSYDSVMEAMILAGGSVEEFKIRLNELAEAHGYNSEETEEDRKTTEKYIDEISSAAKSVENLDAIISDIKDTHEVNMSDILGLAKAHPEILLFIDDADKLLSILSEIREQEKAGVGETFKDMILNDEDFAKSNSWYGATYMSNGIEKTIKTYQDEIDYLHSLGTTDGEHMAYIVEQYVERIVDAYLDGLDEIEEETKSWLEEFSETAEEELNMNWAESTGYVEQVGSLMDALQRGGGAEALAVWETFNGDMKQAVAETYPGVAKAMYEIEKATNEASDGTQDLADAEKGLNRELQKANKYATATSFVDTWQAIQKLEKGTISAADAYDVYNKELNKVVKAGEDITDIQTKIADGTELEASDVTNLASVLGVSTDEILNDVDGAIAAFEELTGETGDLRVALDELNKAAFIRITGVSEADFSNIENGLLAVGDMAETTIKLLEATGQWEVEEIPLDGMMSAYENGKIVKKKLSGMQKVLRATGNNPYAGYKRGTKTSGGTGSGSSSSSGKSSGGGGGGGRESDADRMTEVERMLDRMSQANSIQEYQQSYYQAQKGYYSQTGQLQGVIGYDQKEIDLLKEQNDVLQGNIDKIEKYINIKKAELSSLSISDEKYEEVADDLDKLQQAHQQYSKQLVDNKTSIDQLTKSIEEQQKKIRTMEINLRNTILKAIEDREKRTEKMLNAEISMENTIFDLIKKRYEKERDQIIETTNLKINSLQQERDLLSEQLELRKKQAEEEDKAAELAQLEANYQRIIADPTRRKEALEIQKKITDLREEMAWDAAEKEVEAQQDSIDQQITSLEDYVEYVENYYENLFEHPQKLIAEMREIIEMTDEEIIEWLKNNSDEFAQSSELTQQQMIDGWQSTLDDMHDIIKTHWDEVEWIIEQGEDYIINFLKENSEDYRTAGKLQAEAYVDEWLEQLENLRLAHEQVAMEAAAMYEVIEKAEANSSETGGGPSGAGTNGGGTSSVGAALASGILSAVKNIKLPQRGTGGGTTNTLMKYASGGLATDTGLAWIDGTASQPERVLSPYQTKLFETMVGALESMSKVAIPSMSNYSNMKTVGGNPVSVGDIVVNVDNLDTDEDYEEMADKVCEILMDRIGRTAAIGGLRIRSV